MCLTGVRLALLALKESFDISRNQLILPLISLQEQMKRLKPLLYLCVKYRARVWS